MFQLNNLKPAKGARRKPKRVGRGPGSGHGKTATRGEGPSWAAVARPGSSGQMPLSRIPSAAHVLPRRVQVLTSRTERPEQGATVDGIPAREGTSPARVKVLGLGEIAGAFDVRVHAVSESARKKIEAAGGKIQLVEWDRNAGEDGK
jgi:large subunit ribosomal protein L15